MTSPGSAAARNTERAWSPFATCSMARAYSAAHPLREPPRQHRRRPGIANLARLRDSHCRTSAEAAPTSISEHWRAAMARKNPTIPAKPSARSASDARADLVARAARNAEGATLCRSDPLADAQAARAVVRAVEDHAAELSRRGLDGAFCEAALQLAREIEHHLQAMPAAAVSARLRSQEAADLLADAAATAQAVRTAVLRVTRSADGRRVARDFGLGDPFSTRQPAHVARALTRMLAARDMH